MLCGRNIRLVVKCVVMVMLVLLVSSFRNVLGWCSSRL